MKIIPIAVLLICIECSSAIAQTPASRPSANTVAQSRTESSVALSEDFIIGPQDVLEISVWNEPAFGAKVTVRPDGKIGVRFLNDIQAGGLTTTQLKGRITEALKQLFAEDPPAVSIDVLQINSRMVHIMGEVGNKAASIVLGGPITVVELVVRAGGFTEYAKVKEIKIARSEGGVTKYISFNYDAWLQGQGQQNIELKPRDIVIVP